MQSHTSFLPSDEQLYERSKDWASFFSRIVKEEDYQELDYDDLNGVFADEEEEREDEDSEAEANAENMPTNGCRALVKVEKFEASSSSSDDFDHENLLNETRNMIEERKRKWRESGMDRILDTFDFNAITEKVGSWLRKTKHETQLSSDMSLHEVHYENHQYELHSDDSLQSADTAKYILSNRKPKAGSCTKMIIKRFRYVKGKRKELQKKYNCLDDDDLELEQKLGKRGVFPPKPTHLYDYDECRTPTNHKRHADHRQVRGRAVETRRCCDIAGAMPLNGAYKTPKTSRQVNLESICKTTALTYEAARKTRSRFRKRRSDVGRRQSTSRSSSCDSDLTLSQTKPRFRKFPRKGKKVEVIDLTSDDTKEDENRARTSPQKVRDNTKTDTKKGLNSDVTCFLSENIVNSTAIPSEKNPVSLKAKMCQLSPVKTKFAKERELGKVQTDSSPLSSPERGPSNKGSGTEQQVESRKRKNNLGSKTSANSKTSDNRIVLYNPGNGKLYNESINDGHFVLTEEYLKRSLGKKQALRFITFNEEKFPMKFDLSSTVYFMPPTDSENSHGSESDGEDVFNMFGKQGTIVEQSSLK